MKYSDLIQIYFERCNALETFWTIYVTVVGALLAFCATRERIGIWTMSILTVAFCLFAAANLGGMQDVTIERLAAKQAVLAFPTPKDDDERISLAKVRPIIEPTLNPPSYTGLQGVRTFHIACDSLTILALWIKVILKSFCHPMQFQKAAL